jgi:hypothetical protein
MRTRHEPPPRDPLAKSDARLTPHGDKLPNNRSLGDLGASVTRNNIYYLIIGVLAIVFAAITYHVYQEHKLPGGVHFELGPNGLLIEKK